MEIRDKILFELSETKKLLIIQDIDGVCIPLVKDPMTRKIERSYVISASKFKDEFFVLTNGEHEGRRGVNRLIETSTGKELSIKDGLYLPGLAAGGIEFQNNFGDTSCPGLKEKEISFLEKAPKLMKKLMKELTIPILFDKELNDIDLIIERSVLDTKYSPTINLNGLFELIPEDIKRKKELQSMLLDLMRSILKRANEEGLDNSFYLHIAPNLGNENNEDKLKYATVNDIGTTDIQFMVKGAIKDCGLIVLINKYIEKRTGFSPLGKGFNVRDCPSNINEQIKLCLDNFNNKDMPLIVGVGDTVTSNRIKGNSKIERGGSDRGFLTLIQELGKVYKKNNKIILVDSSWGEVNRPSFSNRDLIGITDSDDPLKFDLLMEKGPKQYIRFFQELSERRSLKSKERL